MQILDHPSLSNDQVKLLSQFANAVYQDTVNVAGWETITPTLVNYGLSNDLISGNSYAKADLLNIFDGEGDANAVLAKQGNIHVLAFRGTDSFRDSLDWVKTYDHFQLFFPLFEALSEYSQENPISQLWVTGHSLGGAMVEHYLDTYSGNFISAVAFASPRASLNDNDTRLLNIGHENDIVYSISGLRDDNANSTTNIYTVIGEEHGSGLAKEHSMTEYIYTTNRILESAYYDQMTRDSLVIIDRTDDPEEIFDQIPLFSNPNAFILGEDDDDDIIQSGRGNDVLEGLGGNDHLIGDNSSLFFGNDTLDGGSGNDILDGGKGEDTAVYSDLVANYEFSISDDGETVTITHSQDGTDTLTNVEFGKFTDRTVQLLGNKLSFVNDFVVGTTQDTQVVFNMVREGDTSFPVTIFVDGEATTDNAVFNDFTYTLPQGENPSLIITASVSEAFGDVAFSFEISIQDDNPLSGLILVEDNDASGVLIGDEVDDEGGWNWGDPHLITFDNVAYDFQASGDFILARATSGAEYEVQVRFVALSSAVSVTEAMATQIGATTVSLEANGSEGTLLINGNATTIADGSSITVGIGSISRTSQRYNIDYGNGDLTSVDVFSSFLSVGSLPSATRNMGEMEGLLGDANGNPADDFQLADGTILSTPLSIETLYGNYATSWLVDENQSLLPDSSEQFVAPTRVITIDSLPLSLRQSAEEVVDAVGISNPIIREAAILDFALTNNPEFIEAAKLTDNSFNPIVDTIAVDPVVNPAIILTSNNVVLDEENASDRTATLTVARGSFEGDITVNYSIVGVGTDPATDDDFLDGIVTGEVIIEDGADFATFEIEIVDDNLVEETEMFDVSISVEDSQASSYEILVSSIRFSINSADNSTVNVIDGTTSPDSITGTNQDDLITGGSGRDKLTGGSGGDRFVYNSIIEGGDTITDFAPGIDKIDLQAVLEALGYNGGNNAIADSHIRFQSAGSNTLVQIDPDGLGSVRPVNFINVLNVSVADMNNINNFVL